MRKQTFHPGRPLAAAALALCLAVGLSGCDWEEWLKWWQSQGTYPPPPPVSSSSAVSGPDDDSDDDSSGSSTTTIDPNDPKNWTVSGGTLTVPEGATSITPGMIQQVPNFESITTVTLPATVTSITGDLSSRSPFKDCTNLTTVDLSGCTGLTTIGEYAFSGCASLKSIDLPSSLTTIGERAFSGCTSLKSIELPDGLTTIEARAFSSCARLTSVDLGNTQVTEIPPFMFLSCGELESVTLPASLTTIGDFAFCNCNSLTTIDLSNTQVNSIGWQAFSPCDDLSTVILPSSWDDVLTIGKTAFGMLDSSKGIQIYIPNAGATADSFNVAENAFSNRSKLFLYYNGTNNIEAAFTGKGVGEGKITVSGYPNLPTQQNLPGQQSLPAFFDFFS